MIKGIFIVTLSSHICSLNITINAKTTTLDKNLLFILVDRIFKDIDDMFNIKTLIYSKVENNKAILNWEKVSSYWNLTIHILINQHFIKYQ